MIQIISSPISTVVANDSFMNALTKYIIPNTNMKNRFLHEYNFAYLTEDTYKLIGEKTTIIYDEKMPHLNYYPHYFVSSVILLTAIYKINKIRKNLKN